MGDHLLNYDESRRLVRILGMLQSGAQRCVDGEATWVEGKLQGQCHAVHSISTRGMYSEPHS